jgi:hypothetical protein
LNVDSFSPRTVYPTTMSLQVCSGDENSMPSAYERSSIVELEREVLRKLCGTHVAPDTSVRTDVNSRERAVLELLAHPWQDAEHRIVFEALARLPGRDAAELQRQLPAQATRMGFPDVEWQAYFSTDPEPRDKGAKERASDIETLITQLQAASQRAES